MNDNHNTDNSENFENELVEAFSTIREIDLDEAQKCEILRQSKRRQKFKGRRALRFTAYAACACLIVSFVFLLSKDDSNFNLNDIVIAGEPSAARPPSHIEIIWQKALEIDGDLSLQEKYAHICVEEDFSENARASDEPLRRIKVRETTSILVFVNSEE